MADIHFAAGASRVSTLHTTPVVLEPGQQERLSGLAYGAMKHSIFSAHLMGGCSFGTVVDPQHRFLDLENLFVVDGSVFPTSLGVNPSETIYALASRASAFVAAASK